MGQAELTNLLSSVCLYLADKNNKEDVYTESSPTVILTVCCILCWLCMEYSYDFISILKKTMIYYDGMMNTHKMDDLVLRLGLLFS